MNDLGERLDLVVPVFIKTLKLDDVVALQLHTHYGNNFLKTIISI